eukprot:CAMPEP_0197528388 /NCGR_PEP_ID=MMETSP1318-20131121/24906_1 /TAXON_ID=552666 /ORGANISM="Partenskyella glossopodia, Strain RCC365" /LENGTH=73 /DNA_ID=CAMNT_0043083463 /DNA_START=321 /DNA_END=542 /DNA_ORIENTATION=-
MASNCSAECTVTTVPGTRVGATLESSFDSEFSDAAFSWLGAWPTEDDAVAAAAAGFLSSVAAVAFAGSGSSFM